MLPRDQQPGRDEDTTGVPAMIAARQLLTNPSEYRQPGVWNVEQLNPDPFMADLNAYGLPWLETWPTEPLPGGAMSPALATAITRYSRTLRSINLPWPALRVRSFISITVTPSTFLSGRSTGRMEKPYSLPD